MLTTRYKSTFNRLLDPLAAVIARLPVSPSAITVAGVIASGLVCWWFVRTRAVLPFCLAIMVTGCFDALDGAVARATRRVSKAGSYLDAVCDRYVETMVAVTVASVTGYWLLIVLVLAGAFMVSYAKARAAMEVPVSNQEWPDLMERAERDVVFLVGLAAGAALPWRPMGRDLFWWTLVLLAVLTHFTVLQRVLRARRFILQRAPRR